MNNEVKTLIDESAISRFQVTAIVVCFVIFILDGFDALVMAFTGPTISDEWGLSATSLGILFSSSLVGMAIGAISLSALADIYGRRAVIILSLGIVTAGMLLSAVSQTLVQLTATRVVTGIGIGAALASVNIIVAEYSSRKRRALTIAVVQTAYPIGATVGGILAAMVIAKSGWRPVFVAGAVGSALMIPVAIRYLPESIDFLLVKRPSNALEKINYQLKRMGHASLEALPDRSDEHKARGLSGLFAPEFRKSTLRLWLAFFVVMFCLYFILSWTPRLLMISGLSASQGISGGVILHFGGIVGQLTLGFLAGRYNIRGLLIAYFGLSVIMMFVFASVLDELYLAMLVAWLNGFFVLGAITGCYTISHQTYPAEIRTTGLGWAIGIGRIGAIISPLTAGLMLDRTVPVPTLYMLFSVSMLVGMFAIWLLPRRPG